MDLQSTLLSAMADYGAIAIFVAILLASIGAPLPATFLLVAAGSFVAQGEMEFWSVMLAAIAGAVIGDHIGYGLGRLGGRTLVQRLSRRFKAESMVGKAESAMHKWGSVSIFLTRWLLTAVGPYINLTSGLTRVRLLSFTLWDILGETIWVVGYVYLGLLFSDQLATISDALGDLVWVAVGVAVIVVIGYKLVQSTRSSAQ